MAAITLSNADGISARILPYGATLQSLVAPDANGVLTDIVLGHDDVAAYAAHRHYLGVTVGRYANRIANGRFTIDGTVCQIPPNEGRHALHGGAQGFDRVVWTIAAATSGEVTLRHVSPDGHAGFPGEVDATVTYTLDGRDLRIVFAATTTRPTILNLTNHALFDLGGKGGATAHRLTIPAGAFTPVDRESIPTGALEDVEGSVFDFRRGRILADGYDHNFALDKGQTSEPHLAARLEDPVSGRCLEVLTTEPGVQLYTGNGLDGIVGKGGRVYRNGDGIALEPQKFPDTPNRPAFGSARVDPGQVYRHAMVYRMSAITG